MTATRRADLSKAIKSALVVLLEDTVLLRDTDFWRGKSNRKIYIRTIEALYDRYLIKIVVESRHKRRHTAMLTDVGEYAARQIQREFSEGAPHGISEKSALFIVEVTG